MQKAVRLQLNYQKKNFNILGKAKVSGTLSNTNVFLVSGMSNKALLEKAKK